MKSSSANRRSICECCGGRTTRLTRYVTRDGDAFAIYYAAYSDNHEPRVVRTIVSFGSWGGWEPGSVPEGRVAFAMDLYSGVDNYEVTIVDAAESMWSHSTILGRMLSRDEALAHDWIMDAFHITDHMFAEDKPLKAFLDESPDAA